MPDSKKGVNNSPRVNAVINAMVDRETLKTDPNGSYTGKPLDPHEKPVQDQDDL